MTNDNERKANNMKKSMTAIFTLAAVAAVAAPKIIQHVPERLDKVRLISPASANCNHVLVVNVGGAIPEDMWSTVVTYALSRIQINAWTNSVEGPISTEIFANPVSFRKTFGENARVAVFIERTPIGAPVTCAPGFWSRVNLSGIDADHPNAQTLRDRYAKMLLKGVAYAAGGGASVDPTCSLCYSSLSLKGLDACGISISPSTYFPMLEILRQAGGVRMLSPARDDE